MQFVLHVYVYVYLCVCERLFSNVFAFKLEKLKFFKEKALHLPLIPFLCQFPPFEQVTTLQQ